MNDVDINSLDTEKDINKQMTMMLKLLLLTSSVLELMLSLPVLDSRLSTATLLLAPTF